MDTAIAISKSSLVLSMGNSWGVECFMRIYTVRTAEYDIARRRSAELRDFKTYSVIYIAQSAVKRPVIRLSCLASCTDIMWE